MNPDMGVGGLKLRSGDQQGSNVWGQRGQNISRMRSNLILLNPHY